MVSFGGRAVCLKVVSRTRWEKKTPPDNYMPNDILKLFLRDWTTQRGGGLRKGFREKE